MKIYGKTSTKRIHQMSRIRKCSINLKHGIISFNACTIRELCMEKGMRLLFAQDIDTNAWFFAFGDIENMKNGIKIQEQRKNGKVVGARVQNKVVIEKICAEIKADRATFNISMHPKIEGGKEWYRIITNTPYKLCEY